MKKHFLFAACAATVMSLGLVSCNKADVPNGFSIDSEAPGLLVSWTDDQATKASPLDGEKAINSLWIFVFDENGTLDISKECNSSEISAKSASVQVKVGQKTVWAIANLTGDPLEACKAATSLTAFEAVSFGLASNSPTSMVMAGSYAPNVTTGTTPCPIELGRRVGRIALGSVKNSLNAALGNITLKGAYLGNVVGTGTVSGAAASTVEWLNRYGTADGIAGHYPFSGSYLAQCPSLTSCAVTDVVANGTTKTYPMNASGKYLYAGPNASSLDIDGFQSTFTPTYTAMILIATINGRDYSYPIQLDNLVENNKNYVVNITIKGLGNRFPEDDVFKPIVKGSVSATVSVSDWVDGPDYSPEF